MYLRTPVRLFPDDKSSGRGPLKTFPGEAGRPHYQFSFRGETSLTPAGTGAPLGAGISTKRERVPIYMRTLDIVALPPLTFGPDVPILD